MECTDFYINFNRWLIAWMMVVIAAGALSGMVAYAIGISRGTKRLCQRRGHHRRPGGGINFSVACKWCGVKVDADGVEFR